MVLHRMFCKFVSNQIYHNNIYFFLVATFKGPLEKQAAFMSEVSKHADVAVILTNQIATFEQDDSQWIANAETLLKLTGDISLGIYETPVPRCRWELVGHIERKERAGL